MKRDRLTKADEQLAAAEAALRGQLLRVLPRAAEVGTLVFVNSRFLPVGLNDRMVSADSEALYESAMECIRLREALGHSTDGTVGAMFLAVCAESASINAHRRGPRRLAQALLEGLQSEA